MHLAESVLCVCLKLSGVYVYNILHCEKMFSLRRYIRGRNDASLTRMCESGYGRPAALRSA